ncbi:hypothetical protein PR202_ga28609 [Eleusine coracana subsp. coracana]|uniref:DUF4220 domain-containing protein n=1 Tax=Eleusine coracana subsp. coracana TaxID=191504 RepID=A0AAV5DKS8_ELECO|nr:hypothetical protein PR202_ga28609 [Eleusine coracana subsp. coracana]
MDPQTGNSTSSTTSLYHLRDLWKSPRRTLLHIEALALTAIGFSFLVVAFGSCRRWSNRWIIQKGFLAANVLSLSLGTYSIGLMQSSPVKSDMYPIWAVSLFTLLPCIEPSTSYYGPDYKSPLSKIIFQICLYFGYVLMMSISTISGDTVNIAICTLCAITFIKGFHRSLALVLPSKLREMLGCLYEGAEHHHFLENKEGRKMFRFIVDFPRGLDKSKFSYRCSSNEDVVCLDMIQRSFRENSSMWESDDLVKKKKEKDEQSSIYDVNMAFALSHLLQCHFLGLSAPEDHINIFDVAIAWDMEIIAIDYKWILKLIELELAFLYDTFFTSNPFLHYYQAKAAGLWAFASLIGICFVGVTMVATHGTMTRRSITTLGTGAGAKIVVDATTADLIVTIVILVSLSLLQLVQVVQCWTSNWSRVAIACECARNWKIGKKPARWIWWMRLRVSVVTRINWFDKYYLWQDKLGQHSIVELGASKLAAIAGRVHRRCYGRFERMLGLQYIGQVLQELLGSGGKVGGAVKLHADVKASFAEFLGQIKDTRIGKNWVSLFASNGVPRHDLVYFVQRRPGIEEGMITRSKIACLFIWHIATCYCELAELEQEDSSAGNAVATACFRKAAASSSKQKDDVEGGGGGAQEKNRRVAIALSKYCAYLLVSAPELLFGRSTEAKSVYDEMASWVRRILKGRESAKDKLEALRQAKTTTEDYIPDMVHLCGVQLAMKLLRKGEIYGECRPCTDDHWKVLALHWVQAFLFLAPYGNVEAHREHLAQGGEFITHLWALLHHLGIREWKVPTKEEFKKMYEDAAEGIDRERKEPAEEEFEKMYEDAAEEIEKLVRSSDEETVEDLSSDEEIDDLPKPMTGSRPRRSRFRFKPLIKKTSSGACTHPPSRGVPRR